MRCNLWLAQPNTETLLRTALRIAGTLFAAWALCAIFGVWSARSALARGQAALAARSQQLSTLAGGMAGKRQDAARAGRVQTVSPAGPGSADFTVEMSALAQTAGAQVTGVQIGGDDKAAGGAAAAAGKSKGDADWQQESFECNVQGRYGALSRFLDGLTASRRVLEFRALQVAPAGAGGGVAEPDLQLKITGVVYGLAAKP